jgi:hypothetical protein
LTAALISLVDAGRRQLFLCAVKSISRSFKVVRGFFQLFFGAGRPDSADKAVPGGELAHLGAPHGWPHY